MTCLRKPIPLPSTVLTGGGFDFLWALDAPKAPADVRIHSVFVRGWIAPSPAAVIDGPYVDCGGRVALSLESRPDVEAIYGDTQVIGFRGIVPVTSEMA